MTIVTKSVCLR